MSRHQETLEEPLWLLKGISVRIRSTHLCFLRTASRLSSLACHTLDRIVGLLYSLPHEQALRWLVVAACLCFELSQTAFLDIQTRDSDRRLRVVEV